MDFLPKDASHSLHLNGLVCSWEKRLDKEQELLGVIKSNIPKLINSEAHVFLPVHEPDVDQADQKSLGSVGTLTFDPSVSFHGPREIMFLTSIIQELKE